MKFSQTFRALAALIGLVNAVNIPTMVTILTPKVGSSVGVSGKGWMIDVVASFTAAPSTSSSAAKRAPAGDDGFFPLLNSPNLTSFKPGPDVAAPGFVCLVSTAPNPSLNYAGVFQLNAITNSSAQGDIAEAYLSWYIGSAGFGSNVNSTVTVFFLNTTAPGNYTGDPMTDPNVISNVATTNFTIFGDAASNTTAPGSMPTPLGITVFTPRADETVGVAGAGWMIDMVIANSDTQANYFAPVNGYTPLYHDNFSDPLFAPGVVSEAVPGLVVLSNTSTLAGGGNTNLANLFQINAVTDVENGVITAYWCTWFVGAAFAGMGQPSSLTVFMVNGTAPTNISGGMPTNLLSAVTTVNFTLSANTTSTGTGTGSGSGTPTGTGSAPSSSTSAPNSGAVIFSASAGTIIFAILAFLL